MADRVIADRHEVAELNPQEELEELTAQLEEVLPKAGLVYSEKGTIGEVLCKPKIIPIKSVSLEALEAMLKAAGAAEHQERE